MLDLIIKNGQCYIDGELKDVDVAVKNGKIEVPLGKRHGIALSALAVTKGDQTPFNILSVEQVLENRSVLIPLNNTVEINKFNGKSVQFLGKM